MRWETLRKKSGDPRRSPWSASSENAQSARVKILCVMVMLPTESKHTFVRTVKDRPEKIPLLVGIRRKRKRASSKHMKSVVAYVVSKGYVEWNARRSASG